MESLVADEQNIDAGEPVPFINLGAQYETIKGELQEAVMRVMESQQFVLGEEVAVFEKAVAKACDSRYAIGCASGTDALILSLQAADIGPGDEVITSPFTFFATAGAIHRVGATPVFVDIEPDGFNINPELVEAAITPRTKAIVPVHIFGQCAEMEPLWRLSVRHNLTLIEDACQAIGSQYRGRKAGVLGAMGCFSFFPTKNLGGAGDGGLITTDDKHLCDRLLRLRVHGDVGGYKHVTVGMNSRLDALQAAILGVKLPHLPSWTKGRQENAENYNELLEHHELCDLIQAPPTLEIEFTSITSTRCGLPVAKGTKYFKSSVLPGWAVRSTTRFHCRCRSASSIWGTSRATCPNLNGRPLKYLLCRFFLSWNSHSKNGWFANSQRPWGESRHARHFRCPLFFPSISVTRRSRRYLPVGWPGVA